MKRALGIIVCALAVVVGGALTFLALKQPAMAAPAAAKVAVTAARLERGKYLVEVLAGCEDCHSRRNLTRFSAPVQPGTTGWGQEFPPTLGFPGKIVAPNITSDPEAGIGAWTDGEVIRAIREGVSKDGHALFPLMPYEHFRSMSDEDVYSVVAYVRQLPPSKTRMPRTKLDFPVNFLVKFTPRPVTGSVAAPDVNDKLKYGEYLVSMADCIVCHTQAEKGELIKGMEFAGGREFPVGDLLVRSANISPDQESGIGSWSEEKFVSKFKGYSNMTYESAPKVTQETFTFMPWIGFSRLTETDLRAIYAYLRTRKAVYNQVEKHPPASPTS